ncbi:hypothetical protein MKW92_023483 [Papaver armeniacum]|nr:hypothetical protein MKW92_023483 [Papaver armeniacum]
MNFQSDDGGGVHYDYDLFTIGGTCVLRGCVPKKLLVYASKYSHDFDDSRGFGWKYETEPILDPNTVDVDGKLYRARHILISVGGRPFIPDIPGKEYAIDSDAALDLPSKPTKIAIVGGGYIAVEFAGIFNGLKSDVHVFIRQKQVLKKGDFVAEQMSQRGIEFHTEDWPQQIIKSMLCLQQAAHQTQGFVFCYCNISKLTNLGLEEVGVKMSNNGAIEVDEYSQTSVPSIWAVGDVTDRINLTPVALMEGGAFAKSVFVNERSKPDYSAVPSAVFSQPPIGPLKSTLSWSQDHRAFMKLIVCAKTQKVIGLHMCGDDAPEITQGFAIVIKARLTKADLDYTPGIHPTAAEEFVTMRTATRKIRQNTQSKGKAETEVNPTAGA